VTSSSPRDFIPPPPANPARLSGASEKPNGLNYRTFSPRLHRRIESPSSKALHPSNCHVKSAPPRVTLITRLPLVTQSPIHFCVTLIFISPFARLTFIPSSVFDLVLEREYQRVCSMVSPEETQEEKKAEGTRRQRARPRACAGLPARISSPSSYPVNDNGRT